MITLNLGIDALKLRRILSRYSREGFKASLVTLSLSAMGPSGSPSQ